MTTHPSFRRRAAGGFTLIEVLISLLIFSVGILGAMGMQVRISQASLQNGDRARASMLADEMASLMWAKQTTAIPTADATDYASWQTRVSTPSVSGLPSGSGTVTVDTATKIATITVTWRPTTLSSTGTASSYRTSVVIP